jgi:Uri superfamily endonuclease
MAKTVLKGTYCLIIHLKNDSQVKVGKLGPINFKEGYYVYVGSALNSLESRLKRHLSSNKKIFWHVDYLLNSDDAELVDIVFAVDNGKWECTLASEISNEGSEIKGFGCSDCKCSSHLFHFIALDKSIEVATKGFTNNSLNPKKLVDLDKILLSMV